MKRVLIFVFYLATQSLYSELTTHNVTHAAKCDVNSVENNQLPLDRLVKLITAMHFNIFLYTPDRVVSVTIS